MPMRPSKDVQVLADFVRADVESTRTLWSTKVCMYTIARDLTLTTSTDHQRGAEPPCICSGHWPHPQCWLVTRVQCPPPAERRNWFVEVSWDVPIWSDDLLLEFLLTDLALAAHGIPSFTLSSLSLLSEVLESHPPSAIVTHASFLPQLLELIYDSAEGEHHTVIVVGDASAPTGMQHVQLLSWATLERDGASAELVTSPRPGLHVRGPARSPLTPRCRPERDVHRLVLQASRRSPAGRAAHA
jgi:long-chain acyl-CoA synthetase